MTTFGDVRQPPSNVGVYVLGAVVLTLRTLRWLLLLPAVRRSQHARSRTSWLELVAHYAVAFFVWTRNDDGDEESAVGKGARFFGSFIMMTAVAFVSRGVLG